MTTPRMASDLADRLIEHAVEIEALRDRYRYSGNAKYPRQHPSAKYAALDQRANHLKGCSCHMCRNPRHSKLFSGAGLLTMQERRSLNDFDHTPA